MTSMALLECRGCKKRQGWGLSEKHLLGWYFKTSPKHPTKTFAQAFVAHGVFNTFMHGPSWRFQTTISTRRSFSPERRSNNVFFFSLFFIPSFFATCSMTRFKVKWNDFNLNVVKCLMPAPGTRKGWRRKKRKLKRTGNKPLIEKTTILKKTTLTQK